MLNKIIIFIVIILVIALGVLGFIYFTREGGVGDTTVGGINLRDYFPFGQGSNNIDQPITEPTTATQDITTQPTIPTTLRQVYAFPVSGAGVFKKGSTTIISFIEKSTGNIYEAETETTLINRISNTTIPKIAEATFLKKDSVLLRYLKDDSDLIETIYGTLSTSTASTNGTSTPDSNLAEVQSTYLPLNMMAVAVPDKKDQIFYLTKAGTGSVGAISNPDGTKKTTVFESPINEWVVQWPKSDTLTLTTKASAQSFGYLYFTNTTTGKMQRILGGIQGLTTLTNKTASTTLFNKINADGSVSFSFYNIKEGISAPVPSNPTFTEKCVWSKKTTGTVYCAIPSKIPSGEYPDSWYKGLISFSDSLWKIDLSKGTSEKLSDIKEASGKDVDAINLTLDDAENFLLFTNKTDLTLWSLDLLSL